MRPFRFRLERARRWQQELCAAEEDNLRVALEAVSRSEDRLQLARAQAAAIEDETRACGRIDAAEIRGWAAYRRAAAQTERALLIERDTAEAAARARREALLSARRRLEMMAKIRSRELTLYQAAEARELEELAQESFSNGLHRKKIEEEYVLGRYGK